ncbi:hypothetical protein DEO72_LG9g773 [Vigna unguiculata]|uniref:Uncharacterized protein n=1 Tax=Vigna unguiculata TaxID=3917 RepID=A0A4D6N132_VIGUN|nr:hypothetical protein DEO72_LG9g773 [Vigna unguiculata]
MSIWTGAIGGGCLFSRRPGGVCSGSGGGGDGGGGGGGGDGGGGLKSCRGEPSPVNSANVVGVKMNYNMIVNYNSYPSMSCIST